MSRRNTIRRDKRKKSLAENIEKREKKKKELASNYFQGILQIRNPNREIIQFVKKQFDKSEHFIAKEVKVRGGIDFYSSNNKFSKKLGKQMYEQFGGELKESAKLFTRNRLTGKNVYRVNILYRVPDIMKGDIVKIDGRTVKVHSLRKDMLKGIDLEHDKKVSIRIKNKKVIRLDS
jgi:NMD protein affecting ribosome stability and mRNA decay